MALRLADGQDLGQNRAGLRRILNNLESKHSRLVPWLLGTAIVITGTLLAYLRTPSASAATVWAEDGRVFLQEYLDQGPGLLAPYDGYLHLLPRSIVGIVTPVFGLEAYAMAVTWACSIVIGLVAALTFYCSSAITSNLAARLCWASIPVLIAPGALETMGNTANLHWYLLWLMPLVLLKPPESRRGRVLLGCVALLIALSEIQAALFLPLVLWQLKNRRLWPAKAAFVGGITCQLTSLWMFPRAREGMGQDWDVLSVVSGYFLNSSAAIIFGSSSSIVSRIQDFGALPIVLSAAPFAIVIILLARLTKGVQGLIGFTWLLSSFGVWAAAVVINPAPYFHYSEYNSAADWAGFFLSRYSTVPSMFLMALIPLLVASVAGPKPAISLLAKVVQHRRSQAGLLGAFLVLQTVHFFPVDAAGSTGPIWSEGVKVAELACLADPTLKDAQIAQSPGGWVATIRCADL